MVTVPGSCGELAQGIMAGRDTLVTCPISWYSRVTVDFLQPTACDREKNHKSYQAVDKLLKKYGCDKSVRLSIQSDLPRGKGMASSSADIAAACVATARAVGKEVTLEEITQIALSIEPTDGVFFPGVVAFDHINGANVVCLGQPPAVQLAMFDFGGQVDTVTFNQRSDLRSLREAGQKDFLEAYELIKEGFVTGNPVLLGKGATISALANQKILPKPHLEKIIIIGNDCGALGVNVAHSGTVAGVLFDKNILADYDRCV